MKKIRNLVLVALTLLVIAEVLLRVFAGEQLKMREYPAIYLEDSLLLYKHTPNVVATLNIPNIHKQFRLNNFGFNDDDFIVAKPLNTIRVAFVGNSITEGIWLNGRSFTEQLEERLAHGNSNIEIMNFAMGGASKSVKNCNILRSTFTFKPDIIFANIQVPFTNDNESRSSYKGFAITYKYGSAASKARAMKFVDSFGESKLIDGYNASYIVRALCRKYAYRFNDETAFFLRQYIQRRYDSPEIIHYSYSLASSIDALLELQREAAANGSRLVFFEFGKSKIYDRLRQAGMETLSLELDLEDQRYYHQLDGHLNEAAHTEICEKFLEHLKTIYK